MAHYAFITDGIVTEVIVGIDETETIDGLTPEEWYGNFKGQLCKRTSYNGNIRKNYAGIGFTFDGIGFAAPQPYPSWIKNTESYIWEAPTPMPVEEGKSFTWDESILDWKEIS